MPSHCQCDCAPSPRYEEVKESTIELSKKERALILRTRIASLLRELKELGAEEGRDI